MKTATHRQIANAVFAAQGKPRTWVVIQQWFAQNEGKPSAPMTYREAKAIARATRQAGGYASVERAA